ncbi:MAG: lipocalin family protein, partial [Cruoricaptor ignavus]|nr:lipocalin family protein [Cruoricaptor ignavus]
MKLKSIFVAISLLLVLSACRKDSSEAEVSTVVGKWLIHSVKFSGTAYGNGQSIPMNNEQVVTDACVARSNFVFNENLSGTAETYELQSGSCTKADSKTFTYEYNSGTKQLKV